MSSREVIDKIEDAYVHNTSLITTSNSPPTNDTEAAIKLTTHMKTVAQDFERKLFNTGGRLNLKKCFWYLISWRWNADGTSYYVVSVEQSPIQLQMSHGISTLISVRSQNSYLILVMSYWRQSSTILLKFQLPESLLFIHVFIDTSHNLLSYSITSINDIA